MVLENTRKPVLLRHRYAGVWLGYLLGPGLFDNTIRIEGRRVWQWRGGRLETSQLAKQGCRESDRLGEWEEVDIAIGVGDGLVEFRFIGEDIVVKAKGFKADAHE